LLHGALSRLSEKLDKVVPVVEQISANAAQTAHQKRLNLQAVKNVQEQYGMNYSTAVGFVNKLQEDPEFINKSLVDAYKAQTATKVEVPKSPQISQERLDQLEKQNSHDTPKLAAAGPSSRDLPEGGFDPKKDYVRVGAPNRLRRRTQP